MQKYFGLNDTDEDTTGQEYDLGPLELNLKKLKQLFIYLFIYVENSPIWCYEK